MLYRLLILLALSLLLLTACGGGGCEAGRPLQSTQAQADYDEECTP